MKTSSKQSKHRDLQLNSSDHIVRQTIYTLLFWCSFITLSPLGFDIIKKSNKEETPETLQLYAIYVFSIVRPVFRYPDDWQIQWSLTTLDSMLHR